MRILYRQLICFSLFFYSIQYVSAQTYSDYIGNGHEIGITVSSSSDNGSSTAVSTTVGSGRFPDENEASRFLAQSSMGANYEDIQTVVNIGINEWLDMQFDMAPTSFESEYNRIYDDVTSMIHSKIHKNEYMSFTFYETLLKHPDVLRQKVAFALSQIFVISPTNSVLTSRAYANSHYYDVLYLGAFGNYRDLLYDVSLHPTMGIYLSHIQNEKPDIIQGRLPDENYAREIMQLFSIGLFELESDGSFKLDQNGELIPTYDIKDIQELAKVFTGLSGSERQNGAEALFTNTVGAYDLRKPMRMYFDFHDKREKVLFDDTVIPADQPGLSDFDTVIDLLYNHPNVGPFIGKRLIQQLVKSNPTPQYIHRVTTVFNNDGNGVRGNMKEVIRAILTDPEARDCSWITDPTAGKLIQPLQRLTNLYLAFDISTPSNRFYFRDENDLFDKLGQSFLAAPTVFNFFTPFYAEPELIQANGLVSPEFQILNSTTGMFYLNETEDALKLRPFANRTTPNPSLVGLINNSDDTPVLDFSDEIAVYQNNGLTALIQRLNLIMCRGQLHPNIQNMIIDTIEENIQNDASYDVNNVIHDALYYIMISASYTILK